MYEYVITHSFEVGRKKTFEVVANFDDAVRKAFIFREAKTATEVKIWREWRTEHC